MKEKGYFIQIPDAAAKKLGLDTTHELDLTVRDNELILAKPTPKSGWKDYLPPLIVALISSVSLLIYWSSKHIGHVKLTGDYSIASFIIVLGIITGSLFFTVSLIRQRRNGDAAARRIYWRNFPTIVLSFVIILAFILMGTFWLLGSLFVGASFDCWTAEAIFGIFNYLINYWMTLASRSLNSTRLVALFTIVIVSGVVIAMASNGQRHWWRYNLSFLGPIQRQPAGGLTLP
ncbi:abc transporter, permease protein [Lactobacillus selangorensis]|uniref:Abc transporter, permease protein n=1 Tax=Lactobacillus selangorensis TaxID=81857 RepID=A0A0R2FHN7_9LACO|nr:hypothetical protein [Lactobacillus selangorensis]KRN28153.1 abc transporter, permease protein [Lactobacillus selangorensis]KRN30971.1 abc transporter, permease protein [Lactobacillus selangorensis]